MSSPPTLFRAMRTSGSILLLFVAISLCPLPGTAQPFDDPNADEYRRGDSVVMMASPRFSTEDLGTGYRIDLLEVKGRQLLPSSAEPTDLRNRETSTGVWLRRRTNDFTLNVDATALGMVNVTFPADTPRRHATFTVYRLTHVERQSVSRLPEAREDAGLLLSAIYYGHAFNVTVVGDPGRFPLAAFDALAQRIESGGRIEPVLDRYDLQFADTGRGLDAILWQTPPDVLPVRWAEVSAMYDLSDPEPVFAEYTLLRDVTPAPLAWRPR